jgi:vanillate/3-O-methylgallate O-demethylase
MVNPYVEASDAVKLVSNPGLNPFANYPPDRAKQFAPCNYDGYVIGDGILFHLDEQKFVFVGRAPSANWIQFHAATGGYDATVEKDDRSPSRPTGKPVVRKVYRYQIQGPNAHQVIQKLNGGPVPDVKFFHMDYINIAGRKVAIQLYPDNPNVELLERERAGDVQKSCGARAQLVFHDICCAITGA